MKRKRTLKCYFSPAPTPIIQPVSQIQRSAEVQSEVVEGTPIFEEPVGVEEPPTAAAVEDPPGPSNANGLQNNPQPQVTPNSDDIVADPGLRIPIDQMDPNIRDAVRRAYISKGPCQPKGHAYPKRKIGNRNRSFQDAWFNHAWLEYSFVKDAAFCLYCYLFKQPRAENYGVDAFTVNGFRGWKDGRDLIDAHSNGIDHNKSRRAYEDFKNQRQSVAHVMNRGGKKSEEEYKGRMLIILGVIRFLLLQAHAFRGHDESSSSGNKGNFLEMVEWYKAKDKNAANLLRHNQMTSPEIQKDICRACAELTTKAILADLGDRPFAILVDEARDASIKEQMAVVLRLVCTV